MRQLLILGTGVHAIEMVEIVERINAVAPTWQLEGFIASEGTLRKKQFVDGLAGLQVMDLTTGLSQFPDAALVPDNSWPKATEVPMDRMVSLIDPTAYVSKTATIGKGCVFYPNCFVGLNAQVGDYTFCLANATINHDDVVEDRVIFATGATLAGFVHVESDCYLGQGCQVRQKIVIGKKSLIGMGAIVVKDVPSHAVMVGNPARKLRDR